MSEKQKSQGGRARNRRSAMERRCLSKAMKRLFAGSSRAVNTMVLHAERKAKHKPVHVDKK